MYEQWHPRESLELFQLSNFPWLCGVGTHAAGSGGNMCMKPSEKPSCAVACQPDNFKSLLLPIIFLKVSLI
jgi:hypothetical protein